MKTRIEIIADLRRQGKTERQIAAHLGIKPNTVTSMEARAKKRQTANRNKVQLSALTHADLDRVARRRGMTVDQLAEELLRIVILDNLFEALLDH